MPADIIIPGSGGGGSGTVTNTGGALTSNELMLGAGGNDSKVAAGFTTDGVSTLTLGVAGTSMGNLVLSNSAGGSITLRAPTGAIGNVTVVIPATTDTLINGTSSQTLTNKSIAASQINSGTLPTSVLGSFLGTGVTNSGWAASTIISGQLAVARGGTGLDSTGLTGIAQVSSGSWSVSATIAGTRVTPRVIAIAYAASITPNGDTTDVANVGALTGALTINAPTGTPTDGQKLTFRFIQDATGGRVITYNAIFAFGTDITAALDPTTASAKWERAFEYNATDSTWRAVAIARGF